MEKKPGNLINTMSCVKHWVSNLMHWRFLVKIEWAVSFKFSELWKINCTAIFWRKIWKIPLGNFFETVILKTNTLGKIDTKTRLTWPVMNLDLNWTENLWSELKVTVHSWQPVFKQWNRQKVTNLLQISN